MSKKNHRFKQYFNWEIKNDNKVIEKHNHQIVVASIKTAIAFLFVLVPVFVFSYILYHNSNFFAYLEKYEGEYLWKQMNLINGFSLKPLLWTGYGFAILVMIILVLFKPFVTGKTSRIMRVGAIYLISLLAFLACLFFALSQFQYSRFYDFYLYEALTSKTSGKHSWIKEISELYTTNYNNGFDNYKWEPTAVVWWVLIGQLVVIFASTVGLQNTVFAKRKIDDSNFEDTSYDFTTSKLNRRLLNRFKNNERNVAFFVLVVAFLIVIPNFVYSILTTTTGTNLNAIMIWSYKMPTLLTDFNDWSELSVLEPIKGNYYGNLFAIGSLPLISLGLTIATLFFFLAILLRGKNISNTVFLFETAILFLELLLTITTMLVSKVYMTRLREYWTTPVGDGTQMTVFLDSLEQKIDANDFFNLIKVFKIAGLDNKNDFQIEWLSKSAIIGEAIITYAFVVGTFIAFGYDIYKLGIIDNFRNRVKEKNATTRRLTN